MTTDTSSDGADAPPPPSARSSRPPDPARTAGSSSTSSTRQAEIGRVGRPHGLDGSFYVTRPEPGALALGMATSLGQVTRLAGTADKPIVRLEGVTTRTAAEGLRGEPLRADVEVSEDEFLAEDLVGLAVVDGAEAVGTVGRVIAYPSCEVLEVGDLLIPLVSDAVRDVDLDAGVIDVDLGFLGAG